MWICPKGCHKGEDNFTITRLTRTTEKVKTWLHADKQGTKEMHRALVDGGLKTEIEMPHCVHCQSEAVWVDDKPPSQRRTYSSPLTGDVVAREEAEPEPHDPSKIYRNTYRVRWEHAETGKILTSAGFDVCVTGDVVVEHISVLAQFHEVFCNVADIPTVKKIVEVVFDKENW